MAVQVLLDSLPGKRDEGRLDDASSETEDQMEGGLLLDVVVGEGASILKLLAGENKALLVRGDACDESESETQALPPHAAA
jgi:hypothetical protein